VPSHVSDGISLVLGGQDGIATVRADEGSLIIEHASRSLSSRRALFAVFPFWRAEPDRCAS